MGIEGELEVADVEGVAELEGTPKQPKSSSLDPYTQETENPSATPTRHPTRRLQP